MAAGLRSKGSGGIIRLKRISESGILESQMSARYHSACAHLSLDMNYGALTTEKVRLRHTALRMGSDMIEAALRKHARHSLTLILRRP